MIKAPYIPNALYDSIFKKIVLDVKRVLYDKEDDFVLMCVGSPGTGKSMLGLHGMDIYLGQEASVSYVGLNREDFARALKAATSKVFPRFCMNDEANISKRDALSQYNKHLIDLYYSIRGLQIFHWWCNPSLDMIDKALVKERIKGLILCSTKSIDKPRLYFYFRQRELLQILEKYNNLDLGLLNRVAGKYAYYRGWFRDYTGHLRSAYRDKKLNRMVEKVDQFAETYGIKGDRLTMEEISKITGISYRVLKAYKAELIANKKIVLDKDYIVTPTGRVFFEPSICPVFEGMAVERRNRRMAALMEYEKKKKK